MKLACSLRPIASARKPTRALTRPQPFPGCVALETKSKQPGRFQKLRIFKGLKKAEPADADTAISAPERCALDMTNHLALIKNERRHEYRRCLIAVEKSSRDAQGAILFAKASRKAAFATNDSGRC